MTGADPEIYTWVGQVWNVGHIGTLAYAKFALHLGT